MKKIRLKEYDDVAEKGVYANVPETALEAVEQLETFFQADMWYAKGAEWKTELEMLRYLENHFKICKDAIEAISETIW